MLAIEGDPVDVSDRLWAVVDNLFHGEKYDDVFRIPGFRFSGTELSAASDVLHSIAAAVRRETCQDDSWDFAVTLLCVLACHVEDAAVGRPTIGLQEDYK